MTNVTCALRVKRHFHYTSFFLLDRVIARFRAIISPHQPLLMPECKADLVNSTDLPLVRSSTYMYIHIRSVCPLDKCIGKVLDQQGAVIFH